MDPQRDEDGTITSLVHMSATIWKDYRDWIAEYQRDLRAISDPHLWVHLHAHVSEESDRYAVQLSEQYGINVGKSTAARRNARKMARAARVENLVTLRNWALSTLGQQLLEQTVHMVPADQRSDIAIKAFIFSLEQMPMLIYREYTHLYQEEDEREAGVIFLAGWVSTRTSLQVNRRLERILQTEAAAFGERYSESLYRLLPTPVFLTAEARRNQRWNAGKFVSSSLGGITESAERALQGYQTDNRSTRKRVIPLTDETSKFAALQDWEAHESARLARYDFEQSLLTPPERRSIVGDVFGFSDGEIGETYSVTASTIRNQRSNARKKLRGA